MATASSRRHGQGCPFVGAGSASATTPPCPGVPPPASTASAAPRVCRPTRPGRGSEAHPAGGGDGKPGRGCCRSVSQPPPRTGRARRREAEAGGGARCGPVPPRAGEAAPSPAGLPGAGGPP